MLHLCLSTLLLGSLCPEGDIAHPTHQLRIGRRDILLHGYGELQGEQSLQPFTYFLQILGGVVDDGRVPFIIIQFLADSCVEGTTIDQGFLLNSWDFFHEGYGVHAA
jgi:hypothetical protein